MEIKVRPWQEFVSHWCKSADRAKSLLELRINAAAEIGTGMQVGDSRVVYLISRLPRIVLSESSWLGAVRCGLFEAKENNRIVISSFGSTGWDYVSWFAAKVGCELLIVLPPGNVRNLKRQVEEKISQLAIPIDTLMVIQPMSEYKLSKSERYHARDIIAFELADTRFPVAVRPRGFWDKLCDNRIRIDRRFEATYPGIPKIRWRSVLKNRDNPLDRFQNKLYHWTRGVYGPWKGETTADYFSVLTETDRGNPRDAFYTLLRIASEGILRGEGRMIKQGTPVISFTDLKPSDALKNIKYRSSLGRWKYEPYGIVLDKLVLKDMGARKVIYGEKKDREKLSIEDQPYFQFSGSVKNDWRNEYEWRIEGDIDLYSIRDSIQLVVPSEKEAELFRRSQDFDVVSMETQNR